MIRNLIRQQVVIRVEITQPIAPSYLGQLVSDCVSATMSGLLKIYSIAELPEDLNARVRGAVINDNEISLRG